VEDQMNNAIPSAPLHVVCPRCSTINRLIRERLSDEPSCGSCKAPLFDGHPIELGGAAFARQLSKSDLPLIVDFWASWCAPCRAMAPVFERVASKVEPLARFAKVDTDKEQELATTLNIRSIPTLAIFKGGKEIARTSGAMDEPSFIAWVRSHI
jgi:thioredoxin 2